MLQICTLQDFGEDENGTKSNENKENGFDADISSVKGTLMVLIHIGAACGWILCFEGNLHWQTVLYNFIVGYASFLGVTMGAQRLWCHRTYKAKFPLRIFLVIAQTLSSQNSIWIWVRDHRLHIKYRGTDGDPRNPKRGFFFSHMGWLLVMERHPQAVANGKLIDLSDLEADPLVKFQKRYYLPLYVTLFVVEHIIPCVFWNETLLATILAYTARNAVVLHSSWRISSLARFDRTKPQKENSQTDSTNAIDRQEDLDRWDINSEEGFFDPTSDFLNLCKRLGLAYDLKCDKANE